MNQLEKSLDLEDQYKMYLDKVNLSESNMHPLQRVETKRAFMGACGQMLVLFRDVLGAIEDEDKAILQMEDLFNQVKIYWNNEANQI